MDAYFIITDETYLKKLQEYRDSVVVLTKIIDALSKEMGIEAETYLVSATKLQFQNTKNDLEKFSTHLKKDGSFKKTSIWTKKFLQAIKDNIDGITRLRKPNPIWELGLHVNGEFSVLTLTHKGVCYVKVSILSGQETIFDELPNGLTSIKPSVFHLAKEEYDEERCKADAKD